MLLTWCNLACCNDKSANKAPQLTKSQRRVFYPNGKLQLLQTFISNKDHYLQHGLELQFYPGAQIKSQGLVLNGKRNGQWKFIGEDNVITIGEYQEEEKSGNWKTWLPDGQLIKNENYFHNQLNGPQELYYNNG